ncbi:abortive infection family protein [Tenacibaculum dicentrarchi]|uniref:Abortive infection protein-like C-terminal domain-containing protein n=1 Tax=Tenacibaculum dicentrarchi TaxID=669041 RepID=A0ABP1EKH1_9FLAO|nr:abortive infection family protein [Tenacibaculum dicentrarchi]MCG8838983.1 abortive infection family protein [Tenacibaculum dicentrarchi]SOS48876.1 conserved hypothetical protein [Tenacibaculum dicentrarchi]SOS52783.1 conserved hypothetical protein [Tenacibaculum dicentrarchi]
MSKITRIERKKLEKCLDMEEGYVLDFVNRTFEDFFLESFNIEIYNEKYNSGNSGSKANRLREFWKKENNYLVGKSIIELLDYSKEIGYSYNKPYETLEECYKIGHKLKDEIDIAEIDAIKPIENTRDYKLLSESIKNHILKNQPEAGLDRLHTYIVGYIRNLCEKHQIHYEKKESLNAIFGKYVKVLTQKNVIESEMTIRILKFSISILDSFNYVRNNQSFAHHNKSIINYSESILILNNVNSLIKFIQEIEEKTDNNCNIDEPENLPF